MNYFNRLLKRTLNNPSLDIKPAITPDSIPKISLNRPKSKDALTQTDDFVNFSTKKSQQASKVTAQPSTAKYIEKQKNSDFSDKKTGSLNDTHDILLQPELSSAITRSDDTASATAQNDSSLKEISTAKSNKEPFTSVSLSSPSSDRNSLFSDIKQKQIENDDTHHLTNHQYQSTSAINSNDIEKQNANTKPHHNHHHPINELDYFSKKIKLHVQDTISQSSSSSSSLNDDETLKEQQYQNLQLISPHLQTDSLKKNDKTDLRSSKRRKQGDFIVTHIASNHKDEIFYPEIKKPVFPITQGGRSHNDSKNQASHTIITINIGRIEIRNSAAPDSTPNVKMREKFSPPLSLGEYLKQRSQQRKI